jgi:hypothetical protein
VGKSKLGHSFFTSAGARLMAERHKGNLKLELDSTAEPRSRHSFAAAAGNQHVRAAAAVYD